jgi:hypothetical protein
LTLLLIGPFGIRNDCSILNKRVIILNECYGNSLSVVAFNPFLMN